MRVAVIGAGLAGLACAARLAAAGCRVVVHDKGRGPGGRMATRRVALPDAGGLGATQFDHGAQYFTARDTAFRTEVERWRVEGLAAPWRAAGEDAWVGVPGMSAPAKALAAGLDVVASSRIAALVRDGAGWRLSGAEVDAGPADAVVVAVPAEQAGPLVAPFDPAAASAAAATPAEPCWTVMACFAEALPIAEDVVKRRGPIGWAARDSAKPGRGGPESWVVQAGPEWSRLHLEEGPGDVVPKLLAALAGAAGAALPHPVYASAHRWRYARSGTLGRDAMWNPGIGLGLCGDWLIGPRIEGAWLSGTRMAERVLAG